VLVDPHLTSRQRYAVSTAALVVVPNDRVVLVAFVQSVISTFNENFSPLDERCR
jgi:hypothetical protein